MNRDLKKYLLIFLSSILISFIVAFSYSKYQDYKLEKKKQEFVNLFTFGKQEEEKVDKPFLTELKEKFFGEEEANEANETSENNQLKISNSKETWLDYAFKDELFAMGYTEEDTRPLYKRIYDKIKGRETFTYKKAEDENQKVVVSLKDNTVIEEFYNSDELDFSMEKTAIDDYSSYSLKTVDKINKVTTYIEDIRGSKGREEYEDGRKIDFNQENGIKNGYAIEYLADGNRVEFEYHNGKRYGQAEKNYKNGDREIFLYGKNELKNGGSIYYFSNGDREEAVYKDGVLQGPARYVHADGEYEIYSYKDGKRVED